MHNTRGEKLLERNTDLRKTYEKKTQSVYEEVVRNKTRRDSKEKNLKGLLVQGT